MASVKKASKGTRHLLSYQGCNFFRQRLVLSSLSGLPVKIHSIRVNEDEPGIKEHEINFLRLIDSISNGAAIEVNETGTSVLFRPGVLTGGDIEHDCSLERGIGYYLESLLQLAPFCKQPLRAKLTGITNCKDDVSVDRVKYVTLPLLKNFGMLTGLELKIVKRGAAPGGGGEIALHCPAQRKLRPVNLIDVGKFKRIRGTAYTMKVSPGLASRMVDAARSILNEYLSDIYIYTDHCKGPQSGNSPGFGLCLMAESTTGGMLSSDSSCYSHKDGKQASPEDLGKEAAMLLLDEICKGGYVDCYHQETVLLFMALGEMDVSKIQLGSTMSTKSIHFLKHLRDFFNVVFKIGSLRKHDDDESETGDDEKLLLTCVGVGYTNMSKPSF